MKTRSLCTAATLAAIVGSVGWLPAAEYVQIATHSPGVAGSLWETDLEIRADGGAAAHVQVDLLGKRRDNTTPLASTTVTVPAGANHRLTDLIEDTFGLTFTVGALRMTTLSGTPSFHSRTANRGFSTFAYDVPVQPDSDAITTGTLGRVIHLTGTPAMRTNLGFVNTSGSSIVVWTYLYRADGTFYGSFSTTLAPFDMDQSANIFPTEDVVDGYAVFQTSTPGGSFLAHAIVIEYSSGEWVLLPAVRDGSSKARVLNAPTTSYLPAAQRSVVGQNTTAWSEVEIQAGPNEGATVQIDLLRSNQDNSSPAFSTVNVPIGESIRLADVLGSEFATTGTGALRLTVTSGYVEAMNAILFDAGGGDAFARYVPLAGANKALGGGGLAAMVLQLARDADTTSDIGVLNLSGAQADVRITLLGADGWPLGRVQLTLAPWEHRELQSVFQPYGTVADGAALIDSDQPLLCYGSVVETTTGDAGYNACLSTPLLFLDGFESGNTSAWSSTVP